MNEEMQRKVYDHEGRLARLEGRLGLVITLQVVQLAAVLGVLFKLMIGTTK